MEFGVHRIVKGKSLQKSTGGDKGGYIGIGMGVFSPYDVFDIDGCIVDGKIALFAQEIKG